MDKAKIIDDLLKNFRHGQVNQTVEEKISRILLRLQDDTFTAVTDWLFENHEGYRLDVRHVKAAIEECKPRKGLILQYEMDCPICKTHFTYKFGASFDDEIKGIHTNCPECGLRGDKIEQANEYQKRSACFPDWFKAEVEWVLTRWEERGGTPYFDRDRRIAEEQQLRDEWRRMNEADHAAMAAEIQELQQRAAARLNAKRLENQKEAAVHANV